MKSTAKKMKLIRQKKSNDCGVACVAMLARVSYNVAKKALFPNSKVGYTDERQVKNALKLLGCAVGYKFVSVNLALLVIEISCAAKNQFKAI